LETQARVIPPEGVWLTVDSVTVTVPIEKLAQRAVGPARVTLPPDVARRWIAEPDSVWVILEGPESLIEQASIRDVTARAIPTGIDEDGAFAAIQPTVSARHRRLRAVGADPDTVLLVRRSR
jgi:hypothetical protein